MPIKFRPSQELLAKHRDFLRSWEGDLGYFNTGKAQLEYEQYQIKRYDFGAYCALISPLQWFPERNRKTDFQE